jgi:hypothetical protein
MRAATSLVRPQIVGANNRAIFIGDKDFMPIRKPISESGLLAEVAWQGVGLASPYYRLKDRPNGFGIARCRRTDRYHGFILAQAAQVE